MITPEKCVKHIMFTLHGCLRVTIAACFGPDQCALNTAIMTIIRGSFLEGHASEEGGWGPEETSQGDFSGQNRSRSLSFGKVIFVLYNVILRFFQDPPLAKHHFVTE